MVRDDLVDKSGFVDVNRYILSGKYQPAWICGNNIPAAYSTLDNASIFREETMKIIGWLLVVIGGYFVLVNLVITYRCLVQKRQETLVPLVGGVLACIGTILNPTVRGFWWVPLLLDPGCVALGACVLVDILLARLRKK